MSTDTQAATNRRSPRHTAARLITEVLAPWVLVLSLPLAIAWHATERVGPTLLWGVIVGATGSILPMIVIVRGARRGDWNSHHVTDREGRVVPFIACISSVAAGITILLLADAPHQMLALALSMFASLLVCSAITFGLTHKISMHAAVAAGAAVTLAVAYGPWLALLLIAAAIIAWSRVELGDHSPSEVTTGLLVGCVTGGALYWALENLPHA